MDVTELRRPGQNRPEQDRPWPAPAKLNRFLHILGRRADGYHQLQTIFQFLDIADELRFIPRSDGLIERIKELPGVPAEQDLSIRAARLLQQASGSTQGVSLQIDKKIPLGGGLGGGSSNAATTLLALNHYWRTGLSLSELAELGLRLGADVPVFVHGKAAWAEGVGEQLTPLPELDRPWFVVLMPACSVATGEVFSDPGLTRDSPAIKIRALVTDDHRNDCETVVFRRYPLIAKAAKWLSKYAKARLSGTGACVFAAFVERAEAEQVLASKPADLAGFVSRGNNGSRLHQRLQEAKIWA